MSTESTPTVAETPDQPLPPAPAKTVRLWPAVVLVAVLWGLGFVVGRLEKPYFVGFLYALASSALFALLYFTWWWTRRRIPLSERLAGFLLIVGGGVITALVSDPSIGGFGVLTSGLPIVLTVWTLWLIVGKWTSPSWKWLGAVVVVALAWTYLSLIRMDGANSELRAAIHWRWTPTKDDKFMAWKAQAHDTETASPSAAAPEWTPSVSPGDWTEFRGTDREGVIRGVTIATDWDRNPPRLLWRQKVGPAWSSVIVVGGRLFTQEQRGQKETVVCYDALTGTELWAHEDDARFWEPVSEAGPRATPTFAEGRLYTLGGTGILNCLDPATGNAHWTRNIAQEAGAKVPLWGFSSSPLVTDGLVVVFAGGEGGKQLLAYHADTSELAWTAPVGGSSYSSPQLATLAGARQCLFLSDQGLTSVDLATGAILWKAGTAMPGAPRTAQPHVVGDSQLVVATLNGTGFGSIDVQRDGEAWNVVPRWNSTNTKPEFPDSVVYDGHLYGFDLSMLCCIDLATGKRCWKAGRYGRGQVVLLADQGLLLVTTEEGSEVVLLPATPRQPEELGRFQAIEGKTWNHPVIAHGRLYVRNAEEMACYELQPPASP
jgi:outer membrane protein assembly factor BamB